MQNNGLDSTQPSTVSKPVRNVKKSKIPAFLVGLAAFLVFVGVVAAGGYSGYRAGLQDRVSIEATRLSGELLAQFDLGVEDFNAGQFDRARQRFEYVLQYDPSNADAIEMLARVLTIVNATATPTIVLPTATPTLTPTPDLRSVQEKLEQARTDMAAQNWAQAIETLLNLRKEDVNYFPVEVDSMLYVAYRNQGVNKILVLGQLESGLYDLAQAALFGPLDAEALNYRDWARFYLIGASFWQVNWGQAAYYFGQIAFAVPNLQDGTGWTAGQRYTEAMAKYVDVLAAASDWCNAEVQFDILQRYTGNPALEPTRTFLAEQCSPPPPPTETPQPTATPGAEIPTVTQGAAYPAPTTEGNAYPAPTTEGAGEPAATPVPES